MHKVFLSLLVSASLVTSTSTFAMEASDQDLAEGHHTGRNCDKWTRLKGEQLTDDFLFFYPAPQNITSMDLSRNKQVKSIARFTNLTQLHISEISRLPCNQLVHLSNITALNVCYNRSITFDDIVSLPKLTSLKAGDNPELVVDFARLSSLTTLALGLNEILNCQPCYVSNIRSLYVLGDSRIRDAEIGNFSNLTQLNLDFNCWITELPSLRNLTDLSLVYNSDVKTIPVLPLKSLNIRSSSMKTVSHLTTLTSLDIMRNNHCINADISPLTNLTSLNLAGNCSVTAEVLSVLPNLNHLVLSNYSAVKPEDVSHLTNLRVDYYPVYNR